MSRRADFLQLVAYALKAETPMLGVELLAEAQEVPEDAIPKEGLGAVVVEYVTWLYAKRRGAADVFDPTMGLFTPSKVPPVEPEWLQEWRENTAEPRVLVTISSVDDYNEWWQQLDVAIVTTEDVEDATKMAADLPASCLPLLSIGESKLSLVLPKREADAFRAWVEATPGYAETNPPFIFELKAVAT